MQTIQIKLEAPVARGLYSLADAEGRSLRDQVRYILRKALLERGLLEDQPVINSDEKETPDASVLPSTATR